MSNRLIGDEQRSKAAAWAYFSGEEEHAVKILMSSESEWKIPVPGFHSSLILASSPFSQSIVFSVYTPFGIA
jgi:hypothetical protein